MADLTSYEPAMKRLYPATYEAVALKKHPIQGVLSKKENFLGNDLSIALAFEHVQGGSSDFATAQNNVTDSEWAKFLMTRTNLHQLAHIDGETAEASMAEGKASFVAAIKHETDSALKSLANKLETYLPLSGTGTLGTVGTLSTSTLTLNDTNLIFRFAKGMTLVASATDGGAIRAGTELVAGINRRSGTLTSTSAAWTTVITALATSDSLYTQGDAANGASLGSYNVPTGFASWFPATAPSSGESFFGQDRSTDSRMYGTYYDGSNQKVQEALIDGLSEAATEEGEPTVCFMHHVQSRRLAKEMENIKRITVPAKGASGKAVATVGYSSIVVQGDESELKVISSNRMPSAVAYMIDPECCFLLSIKQACRINDLDGNRMLRRANDDGVEVRTVFRGNFASSAPVYNTHVALPAA